MCLILTVEVSSNDEVVVLEEAPPLQVFVRNECGPAQVCTTVAPAAAVPHCS